MSQPSTTAATAATAAGLQDYRSVAAARHAAWLANQNKTELANPPPSVAAPNPAASAASATEATVPNITYIYVLLCSGGKYYVGETHNVSERFAQHLGKGTESNNNSIPGAAWTRKHEPIEIIKQFVKQSVHDEDNTTLDYMVEHGIRNVRGGSFCMVKLPRHIRRTIKQQLATIKKLCYRCKQPGHCANNCAFGASGANNGASGANNCPTVTTASAGSASGIKPLLPSQRRSWIDHDSEEEEEEETKHSSTIANVSSNSLFTFDGDERLRAPRAQSEPEQLIGFAFDPTSSDFAQSVERPRPRPPPLRYLPKTAPLPPQICARCGRNNHSATQCFAKHHLHGHVLPPR